MTIAFNKTRCLICWKKFYAPALPDMSYGENLYYDKTDKTFAHFSWFDNNNLDTIIRDFLSANKTLETSNDNTKGNLARQLVGLMADGNKECILGFYRCPRCGYKFTYASQWDTVFREIEELSFSKFFSLNTIQRNIYLLNRIKNNL